MSLTDYIYKKPTIETERLFLRPMTREDVPALCQWMPDKAIYTYWGKNPGKAEKNPALLFDKEEKQLLKKCLGMVNHLFYLIMLLI